MENELAILGAALLLAGLFARAGRRIGLPTIPFFILAGIVFGPHTPGFVVLDDPDEIYVLATLGLVLLLFALGIEFSIDDLVAGGRRLLWAGGSYIALNFGAGLVLGWALGWGTREIFVIAGMIGTSSTAIVTKLILDLRRVANPETGMILGIIVVEDVFLAFYLALLQPILGEQEGAGEIVRSVAIAFVFLMGLFALAFTLAEGAGTDWISLAAIDGHGAAAWAGTLAFAAFLAAMTAGRWFGPGLLDRYGRVRVVRALTITACAGTVLFVVAPAAPLAYLGAVLWGLGISLGFPVAVSAAGEDPELAAGRVSVISSIGYCAFLAGPPAIGFLGAHVTVLRALLAVAAVLAVAAIGSGIVARRP